MSVGEYRMEPDRALAILLNAYINALDEAGVAIADRPVGIADGDMVTLGAKADNRNAATDTTAVSSIGLLKQISYMLQNPAAGAVTIADGADVTMGALADALVVAGAIGSVSAKLRRLTTDLDALLTELKVKADPTETQAMRDTWRASLQVEETADDSDKTFTVPATTEWMPMSIWIELATTVTVGARQIEVQFTDGSDDAIGAIHALVTQAASLTYNYLFGLGLADGVKDGTYFTIPLPAMILPAGFKIRVYDNNAVAAAADDMVIQMLVNSRSVA